MKAKVTEGARTVWLQETKQVTIQLEDGTEVMIRQMEDDNGTETYCWIEEHCNGKGGWKQPHELEDELGKEFAQTIQNIANGIFMNYWDDEQEFNWDEVEDPFEQ